jgi:hypothetical protein
MVFAIGFENQLLALDCSRKRMRSDMIAGIGGTTRHQTPHRSRFWGRHLLPLETRFGSRLLQ